MNEKKKKNKIGNQRGVALMFALGMLGLMSVLALAFASVSLSEKKNSENSSYGLVVRALAQSALNRVRACVAMATVYTNDTVAQSTRLPLLNNDYRELVSKDYSAGIKHLNWLWKLGFPNDSIERLFLPNAAEKAPEWQYVRAGANANDPLVGRFAYVVIPITTNNSGVFDPTSFGQFQNDKTGTQVNPSTRMGRGVYEIGIDTLVGVEPLSQGSLANFREYIRRSFGPFSRIRTFDQLFGYNVSGGGAYGLSGNASFADVRTVLTHYFTIPSVKNPEAFWMTYPEGSVPRLFHRFNLARTDWNTLTVKDILGLNDSGGIDESKFILYRDDVGTGENRRQRYNRLDNPGSPPIEILSTDSLDSVVKVIPWIALWQDKGDFPNVEQRRKQIAANLIDYFDTNSVPTSDSSDWESIPPTYTGNERTPYLNEIVAQIRFSLTRDEKDVDNGDGTTHKEYQFTFRRAKKTLYAEVIDFFNSAVPPASSLIVAPKLYYRYDKSGSTISGEQTLKSSFSTGFSSNTDNDTTFYMNRETMDVAGDIIFQTDWILNSEYTFSGFQFQVAGGYALLRNADYANLTAASEYQTLPDLKCTTSQATSGDYCYSFQVDDPRHNLLASSWTRKQGSSIDSTLCTLNVLTPLQLNGQINVQSASGALSAFGTAGTDRDSDNYWKSSSSGEWAHVPVSGHSARSPWELGAIHRAGIGQTLNLLRFNGDANVVGGGVYDKGDVNILDQVKMSAESFEYGKINVYKPYDLMKDAGSVDNNAFAAIFSGIKLKETISGSSDNDLEGDTAMGAVPAKALLGAIRTILASSPTYNSRAAFLGAVSSTLGNGKTTDAAQEELIGKTSMLFKAERPQHDRDTILLVVVLAQSIKEGAAGRTYPRPAGFEAGYTDYAGNASPFAEPSWTPASKVTGIYQPGADRIMGEQKIAAWLMRDHTDQKWKIVKVDYVE